MSRQAGGWVLVVDDEADMVDIMALVLESSGYSVLTARNGLEAFEILRTRRPCVILLDLMMPGMDGWQFRTAQRGDPELAGIPVVVVTGAGLAAEKKTPCFEGVAGFLEKPVSMSALLRVVAEHCSARGA